jgi:pheromone shutdown protein TraB
LLPAAIDRETEPTIRMAGRSLSPDEELKMMTSLAEMYKLSFPEETILSYARKFIDIDDDEAFIESIKDYQERAQEVLEAAKAAHEANPSPQNQGGKTPGKDNKLK